MCLMMLTINNGLLVIQDRVNKFTLNDLINEYDVTVKAIECQRVKNRNAILLN